MKKLYILALAGMIACSAGMSTAIAQDKAAKKQEQELVKKEKKDKKAAAKEQKERQKEREDIRKMAQKELGARVSKDAAKEAKRLAKEGWEVRPGSLPLEKQLDRAYTMQYQYDEENYPKYIFGEATSVGQNYDAAKMSASSLALNDLARQISVELTALIEETTVNKQLDPEEALSLTETVETSKQLISQTLGRTIPVVECFRINSKKNTEVMVRVAYDGEKAKKVAREAMRKELEKKGERLQEQLDKILGL